MIKSGVVRLSLLLAGLAAILLSFALQGGYATDAVALTSPSTLGLFALAGVAAIALSLFRGRRK